MISEFGILTSIAVASLLQIVLSSFRKQLKTIESDSLRANSGYNQNGRKRLLRRQYLILGLLSVIIILRAIWLIALPLEFNAIGINTPFLSVHSAILVTQVLVVYIYIFMILVILINRYLQPDFRISFNIRAVTILSYMALADIIVSLSLTGYQIYQLMYPAVISGGPRVSSGPEQGHALELIVMLFISFIVSFILQKRFIKYRSSTDMISYIVIFLVALFLIIYSSITGIALIIDRTAFGSGFLNVFSYPYHFYGLVWFLMLGIGIIAQFMAFLVNQLKSHFLNIHFSANYVRQLSNLAFIALWGIGLASIVPRILQQIYQ